MSEPDFSQTVSSLLDDNRRCARLLGVVASMACIVVLSVWGAAKLLGINTSSISGVQIGGVQVMMQQPIPGGGTQFTLLIQPQEWQATKIPVNHDDVVEISATGHVSIDAAGLYSSALTRARLEREGVATGRFNPKSNDRTKLPETLFEPRERADLVPHLGWVGPDGYFKDNDRRKPLLDDATFQARTESKIKREAAYGALLGAVVKVSEGPCPSTGTAGGMTACTPTETFVVGSSYEKRRWEGRNGLLWFVVNDAWNPDPGYPNMFYDDNVGFYLVQVSVTPSR